VINYLKILLKKHAQKIRLSDLAAAFFYSILAFLFLRLFTSIILLIGIFQPSPVFPYAELTQNNIHYLEQRSEFSKLFLAPWYRWDTSHYIEITDFGYDFDQVNSVWPPLYPFLIKVISFIFKPTLLSALVVSNLFFIFGLVLFYLLTKELFSEEMSKESIFYMVVFPTSFFFVAGYTESLFLFFSIAVFLFLRREKWLLAGIFCFLASITRVQGLFLTIPILYELIIEYRKDRNFKSFIINSFPSLYAPFSYGLFSLYIHFGLRNDWPWQTLSANWSLHFDFPWKGLIGNVQLLLGKTIEYDVTPDLVKILNLLSALLVIFFLIKLRKKIPVSISIYSWIMLFIAIGKIDDNNALVSLTRYVLTIFPLFWGFALIVKNKYLKLGYFVVSISLQIVLLVYFYWWYWVA